VIIAQNTGSLEDFKRVRTLGAGAFGRVILCQHHGNRQFYAIKVLDKAKACYCVIILTREMVNVKLVAHYPCPRAVLTGRVACARPVNTDVHNDARVHGP